MTFFPRHRMHSRPCRVVAWLVSLLLAASPLHAAPSHGMAGMLHHDHGHAAAVVHDPGHAAPTVADDCCAPPLLPGQAGSDACHCASMCASTLPAMAIARLDRVGPAAPLVTSRSIHAPRGVHTRLLRPPAS